MGVTNRTHVGLFVTYTRYIGLFVGQYKRHVCKLSYNLVTQVLRLGTFVTMRVMYTFPSMQV